MKVLLLTQVLPYPPDSGPKVKTLNMIKCLAQKHDLTLVSFVRGDQSREIQALKELCRDVYPVPIRRSPLKDLAYLALSLITGQPFLMLRDRRSEMGRLIHRLAQEESFDIVHADQLNMAQYARLIPAARKVLDAHNALWLLYKRLAGTMPQGPKKWLLERDWRLLKRYEGAVCREFDSVLAVSEEDRQALEEAAGEPVKGAIVPITVDTQDVKTVERHADAGHILSIGTMYWPPNIDGILWFLQEVWPIIRASNPHTIFDIVGANPPEEIVAFGKKDTRVNVTGYVEDPQIFLAQAALMVVPLRAGGGMRVKILNALSAGLPVVSTTLGREGIAVENGKHILIADTPESFARAVLGVLENPELGEELGCNGRKLIESIYDYRIACTTMDAVYDAV